MKPTAVMYSWWACNLTEIPTRILLCQFRFRVTELNGNLIAVKTREYAHFVLN
jgi:hypothetical protein